jgi:hypothetical protein
MAYPNYPSLLTTRCTGGHAAAKQAAKQAVAVEAAKQAVAAKAAMSSAAHSAKTAIRDAGHSATEMLSAWKKQHSSSPKLFHAAKLPASIFKRRHSADVEESPLSDSAEQTAWSVQQDVSTTLCEDASSEVPAELRFLCDVRRSRLASDASTCCGTDSEYESDMDASESGHCEESWRCLEVPIFEDEEMEVRSEVPMQRQGLWKQWFSDVEMPNDDDVQHRVSAETARQIDLDVPRTRPESLNETHRTSLRRVLQAYAAYDPAVGYCQGMNDIVAIFVLLGFDEAASFRGLCTLTSRCCPDYFNPSLEGYVRDMQVLKALVSEFATSETEKALEDLDLPLHAFAAHHFLVLGSHTWPLEAVVRLWDIFFAKGSTAVFASFIVLLELYMPKGKHTNDGEKVEAFREAVLHGVTHDLSTIVEYTWQLLALIPAEKIPVLRRASSEVPLAE